MKKPACILILSAALFGCAHHQHHGTALPPKAEPPKICHTVDVAEPVDAREACPPWRRVALKTNPDSECPDPGSASEAGESWRVRHLFAAEGTDADPASARYAAALPPALRAFCLYEYPKNDSEALSLLNARLDGLVGTERAPKAFRRVDFGCVAVGPAGEGLASEPRNDPPPSPWQGLESYFQRQVGDVDPVTVLGAENRGEGPPPRVRLTFLDTQPNGTSSNPSQVPVEVASQHGLALSRIAREIACDEPEETSCAAKIDFQLALPILNFDRYDPEATKLAFDTGGFSGSVDLLATAVWDAVRGHDPRQRLVLNLSVAWDGELFGGLEKEVAAMPVTVQAMYRALQVASCRGALAVAAAGNLRGGPGSEHGPLLPGGWERRDAPTFEACGELLGLESEGRRPLCVLPEPLVYAAGGVRFDNSPLYNSRPGGTPSLVAYADHAWVGGSLKPLTGTSVATAVVSATAAVLWHHWPHLTRAAVMDRLYRAGEPIGRTADFHHRSLGEHPTARRVSLCPVLAQACAELGGDCPADCLEPPSVRPTWRRRGVECDVHIDADKIREKLEDVPFCGLRTILYDPAKGLPADPCPDKQFYGATANAWHDDTLPQPEDDPCLSCGPAEEGAGFTGGLPVESVDRKLLIEIAPEWRKSLSQAFLDVGDTSLSLGVGELRGGSCVLVDNFDVSSYADPTSHPYVVLRFRTVDRRVVSIPLLY